MKSPNYKPLRNLGEGSFGSVFLVEDKTTKIRYAIKRVQRTSNQLSRQYEILKLVQGCEHIVKIHDYYFTKNNGKTVHNIVFEYVETSLETIIQDNYNAKLQINEHTIKDYMFQLLKGLTWIHSKEVAHRDLKPENVLVSAQGIVKICDFGSSKVLNKKGVNTPYIVSRYYRAPELIMCVTKYSVEIDIWAAGCIFAELFLQRPIFKGKTEGDQLYKIIEVLGKLTSEDIRDYQDLVPFDTELMKQFPSYPKKDLQQIFTMVADKQQFLDLLLKMLSYSPSKRISAESALKHPYFKTKRAKSKPAKRKGPEPETEVQSTILDKNND